MILHQITPVLLSLVIMIAVAVGFDGEHRFPGNVIDEQEVEVGAIVRDVFCFILIQ